MTILQMLHTNAELFYIKPPGVEIQRRNTESKEMESKNMPFLLPICHTIQTFKGNYSLVRQERKLNFFEGIHILDACTAVMLENTTKQVQLLVISATLQQLSNACTLHHTKL